MEIFDSRINETNYLKIKVFFKLDKISSKLFSVQKKKPDKPTKKFQFMRSSFLLKKKILSIFQSRNKLNKLDIKWM